MSGFTPEWLALREDADQSARASDLTAALTAWASDRPGLKVIDLGAGTGANLCYLAPCLGHDQHWRLFDHDARLLEHLPDLLIAWSRRQGYRARPQTDGLFIEGEGFSVRVRWTRLDLATDLGALALSGVDLLTASALLDLVSGDWLDRLARLCHNHGCAAFFVLTYDGRIEWQPACPADVRVRTLLNRHQRRDKGFGPALGPDATRHASDALTALGFQVKQAPSDWRLPATQADLQRALATGWADAALETEPEAQAAIATWRDARIALVQRQASQLTVGHQDVLAFPLIISRRDLDRHSGQQRRRVKANAAAAARVCPAPSERRARRVDRSPTADPRPFDTTGREDADRRSCSAPAAD